MDVRRLSVFIPPFLRPVARRAFRSVRYRATLLVGRGYICPICYEPTRRWLPTGEDHEVLRRHRVVGAGLREGLCPSCQSTDRDRLVYLHLKNEVSSAHPMRVLHLAPEPHIRHFLTSTSGTRYVSGDLMEPSVDVRFDVLNTPFQDGTFDLVVCNHVLEHVPNDIGAMKEIYRILNRGGRAVLQVPVGPSLPTTLEDVRVTSPEERERLFGQNDHVRIYSPSDYTRRLASAGFDVIVQSSRRLGGRYSDRLGLAPMEALYCAVKGKPHGYPEGDVHIRRSDVTHEAARENDGAGWYPGTSPVRVMSR